VPAVPDAPDCPVVPAVAVEPACPLVPAWPVVPALPDVPACPAVPTLPAWPGEPVPAEPDIPLGSLPAQPAATKAHSRKRQDAKTPRPAPLGVQVRKLDLGILASWRFIKRASP
jgi:hypothetical protein